MPNIAVVLKQEIARLARREGRALIRTVARNSAQHRRHIAALRREVEAVTRQVQALHKAVQRGGAAAAQPAAGRGERSRFQARGLRTHRKALGLSAADYAKLVGVSSQTIYLWEQGKSRPRAAQLAAYTAVRELGKREAAKKLEALRESK